MLLVGPSEPCICTHSHTLTVGFSVLCTVLSQTQAMQSKDFTQ